MLTPTDRALDVAIAPAGQFCVLNSAPAAWGSGLWHNQTKRARARAAFIGSSPRSRKTASVRSALDQVTDSTLGLPIDPAGTTERSSGLHWPALVAGWIEARL
jgi:hypothetical protein